MQERLEKISEDVRIMRSIIYALNELVPRIRPDYRQMPLQTSIEDLIQILDDTAIKTEVDIRRMNEEIVKKMKAE